MTRQVSRRQRLGTKQEYHLCRVIHENTNVPSSSSLLRKRSTVVRVNKLTRSPGKVAVPLWQLLNLCFALDARHAINGLGVNESFANIRWNSGLLDYWIIGLLDYWIIGLLDYWIIVLVD